MNAITPNLSKPCKGLCSSSQAAFKLPIAKQPKALYNIHEQVMILMSLCLRDISMHIVHTNAI